MGTSKDFSGQTGGGWTHAKRVASQISRQGPSRELTREYASSYVDALGGNTAASQSATTAVRTAASLASFLQGVRSVGLTRTLEELGLGEAVGRSSIELIGLLVDLLAGDGATLDDVAAREALVDCLDEEFGNQTYTEIDGVALDEAAIRTLVGRFIGRFVFRRCLPLLSTRLNRATPGVRRRAEEDLRDWAESAAIDAVRGLDVTRFNPVSAEGRALAESIVQRAYEVFGS